jgi:RNA polymerase sigma-70 factor, ECF subfamily
MVGVVIEHPEVRAERLLRSAREGDHEAFGEIVKQHESMVFSIALHALREASLAEELAQEVFLRLFRDLNRIESGAHLVFWLRRVTTNRCIDQLRRMRQLGIPVDEATDLLVLADEEDYLLHRRLRGLVASLPPKQRLAVILRYQEELEPTEISSVMKIPLNTVKSHLRRALASLRLRFGVAAPERGRQSAEGEI